MGSSASGFRVGRTAVLVGLLALLAGGTYGARRLFIRSWLELGPTMELAARPRAAAPAVGAGVRPLRVLLIDGLGLDVADGLPALGRLCAAGVALRVDSGFPAVSLPVQHALWTGVWQTQSGVMFVVKRLAAPIFPALPAVLTAAGSRTVAVAEKHREIVDSFGFARVIAPAQKAGSLSPRVLQQRALEAAAGDAALVLVHFLGVDIAGHEAGGSSARYLAEARRADRLVAALFRARDPQATLLVLADHGHLSGGGHGGREAVVRWTRACMVGPGLPAGARAEATIVDLNRLLTDRLGIAPLAAGRGRALAELLGGRGAPPQPFAPVGARALPLVGGGALLLLLALVQGGRRQGAAGVALALPWPLAAALVLLIALHGLPSLSRSYVYPALPWSLALPAAVAGLLASLQLWLAWRRDPALVRAVMSVAAALLGPALALIGATGWPLRRAPLIPGLSATASAVAALAMGALALLAVTVLWLDVCARGTRAARAGGRSGSTGTR